MINVDTLTIHEAHAAMKAGTFSATDLAKAYLARIKERNATLNAYLEVFDDVLEQAAAADARFKAGTATTLTGIPLAVKDNILIKGRRAGSASKILEGYIAPYDATAIAALKREGAVFLGRTNMDEFAMGGSNENSAYGPVKNPHDETRVSGGSSGGSTVAVAAGMALAAIGSDTGGSVREPASFCGIIGFKPSYGAISRYGLMAMGSSLDQIGVLARSADDARIIFHTIRGNDTHDSTTLPQSVWEKNASSGSTKSKGRTIGVPRHFMKQGVDADVLENFNATIDTLKKAGYTIKDVELPNLEYALAVYYIIMPAEAASNLGRFDGVKYGAKVNGANGIEDYIKTRTAGFGPEVKRRIILGNYILSAGYYDAYYRRAVAARELIRQDFAKAFEKDGVDFIATPTSPMPAFKIGEKSSDPLQMYLADIFTVTANLAAIPGISVPTGTAAREGKDLPLGTQFVAPWGKDDTLFDIATDIKTALG